MLEFSHEEKGFGEVVGFQKARKETRYVIVNFHSNKHNEMQGCVIVHFHNKSYYFVGWHIKRTKLQRLKAIIQLHDVPYACTVITRVRN